MSIARFFAVMIFSIASQSSLAEIYTSISDPKNFVAAISNQPIKILCRDCGVFEKEVRDVLKEIARLDRDGARDVVVYGSATVYDRDHVITVSTDKVMESNYPNVPARIKKDQLPEWQGPVVTMKNPDVPAEITGTAAQAGYNIGGAKTGLVTAVLFSFMPFLLPNPKIDGEKIVGVVRLKMVVDNNDGNKTTLTLTSASSEAVDPKEIVRTTYERLIAYLKDNREKASENEVR